MLIAIFVTMVIMVIALIFGIYLIIQKAMEEKNPDKCFVFPYVEQTLNKPIWGHKIEKTANGIRYKYKKAFLDVPINYPVIWFKKRRTLFIDINNDLITRFDNPLRGFKLTAGDKDDLQFELGTSNLVTQALKAFKGKNDVMLMIIAIIIFVVGGVLGYGIGKMTTQPKAAIQQQIVPAPAIQTTPPEIKVTPVK
jgi:hypothetical protein